MSSQVIPTPSSSTTIDVFPPSIRVIRMREASASKEFSIASFTTDTGRSTTSPAAILRAISFESLQIPIFSKLLSTAICNLI